LPDADTCFERATGRRVQTELRQVGRDDLTVSDDALREQRLINKRRAVSSGQSNCRNYNIDFVRFSARSERVDDVRNLVINLSRKNSPAGAKHGFRVVE